MNLSAGTGLAVSVAAGRAVISDGAGGCYLVYFDASTSVTGLGASSTNSVYATVDLVTGQGVLVRSATPPTNPYILVGTAVTSATAVTSTTRGTAATSPLPTWSGTSLTVPGSFVANATGIQVAKGLRLGAAANYQMRYAVRAARALSRQLISASTWSVVQFDRIDHEANDYGGTSVNITGANQGLFVAPVSGTYHASGRAHFVNQAGTTNLRRQMRLVNRTAAGASRWVAIGSTYSTGDNFDNVFVEATLDMLAGQTLEFQVYQDETHSVYLSDNSGGQGTMAVGDMTYGMMTLISTD